MPPDMYTRFNRPVDPGTDTGPDSLTQQEFKDECDINVIMAKAVRSGQLPPGAPVGSYADFSEVGDFQRAQEIIVRAKAQFESLPSAARERFANDPARFLAWVHNPDTSLDEAEKLGLLSDVAVARRKAEAEARAAGGLKKELEAKVSEVKVNG